MHLTIKRMKKRWEDQNYPLFFSLVASKKTDRRSKRDGVGRPYPYHTWDEAVEQAKYLGGKLESWVMKVFDGSMVVNRKNYGRRNAKEPNKFQARLFEITQVYDMPKDNRVPIVNAIICVEGNQPFGDPSLGYSGVLRLDYGFPGGNFKTLETRDSRIEELLKPIAKNLVLQDRVTSDPIGLCIHFAMLQKGESYEHREFDKEAWKVVAPEGLAVPKVYSTNRKI